MLKIKNNIHQCLDKIFATKFEDNLANKFSCYLDLIALIKNGNLQYPSMSHYFEGTEVVEYVKRARLFFHRWELHLESLMQTSFMQSDYSSSENGVLIKKIQDYYVEQYRHLVMSEIRAANISQSTRVCHVGIGYMPLSLIMLHKYSGKCSIVGIDYIAAAISSAQACINYKYLREPNSYDPLVVHLQHAEGAEFNYQKFDVVILSSSIMNKQSIVDRIKQTADRNVILLDRKIHGLSHYIYESSSFVTPSNAKLLTSLQAGLIEINCYQFDISGEPRLHVL